MCMYRSFDLQKILQDALVVDELLCDVACRGDHREAAVVDLLGLEGCKLLWRLGSEAEGVKPATHNTISTTVQPISNAHTHT